MAEWASGQYRKRTAVLICRKCGEEGSAVYWTEFGVGGYDPEECPYCGEPYTESSEWDCDGPDQD